MGRGRRRPGRRAAHRRRRPRLLPPPPRVGPPLPAPPAHRARGEHPHREGRHRLLGVEPAVRRAHLGDRGRPARRPDEPRAGALGAGLARPRAAPGRGRGGHRRPRAGPAHPGLRVQHPHGRQVHRRPAPPLRLLDRQPEPRQRGERRVGPGPRRRRGRPLRHPPALVPAEGAAARRRPPRRLRPQRLDRRRRRRSFTWSQATEVVLDAYGSFSDELAGVVRTFLDDAGSTPRCGPASDRARSAPTPCRAPTRTCCSTGPARRRDVLTLAHELGHGLHAYLARRAGHLPPDDAAHPGRDRLGVRRDRHLRAAARRDVRSRPPVWRCSPRASRARSPPCSARSR